jgi:hypothetical protein
VLDHIAYIYLHYHTIQNGIFVYYDIHAMPFIVTTLLLVQSLIAWSTGYDLSLLEVGISETEFAVNTMIE